MFTCSISHIVSFTYPSGPAGIFDVTGLPWMIRTPDHLVKSQMLFLGTLVTKRPT